jgi:hypothetical protein
VEAVTLEDRTVEALVQVVFVMAIHLMLLLVALIQLL